MILNAFKRPRAEITSTPELMELLLRGQQTAAGVSVSSESALRSTAVYACVTVIAETCAQLPLITYERTDNGKQRAKNHELYGLLHDQPNKFQTSFDWRMSTTVSALLKGAGYSYVNRSVTGKILEILPIPYDSITLELDKNSELHVFFTDLDGKKIELEHHQIHRMTGVTLNGWQGISPIEYHRQTVGIAIAADQHAAVTFKNGAKPSGVLVHPGTFSSNEVAQRVRESWVSDFSGEGAGGTPLLEDGLEFKPVSMNNRDAQYIETRKFQLPEIARIFHMQPHKIGDLDRATNNNIEDQSKSFIGETMMPWFLRWEQSISRDLITRKNTARYFACHNVDGFLRGNMQARADYYQKAVGGPFMTQNEARELEDLPVKQGLDDVLTPLNMIPNTENDLENT